MLEFQKKRNIERRLYSKTALVILVIILFFLVRATWKVYEKKQESQADREHAEQQLANLETKNTQLVAQIARLKTEKGTEEEIRQKFSVAKEGERAVVVVDDETPAPPAPEPVGFWKSLWMKLTGK